MRLKLEEVSHLDGKPLPLCKPTASRRDATSEEKEKLKPKAFCENYYQGYLSTSSSSIRLLHIPVIIGTKISPAHEKSYIFWDACVQLP